MTIDLSSVGDKLLVWLREFETEMDTTRLQSHVQETCFKEGTEEPQTAVPTLLDLSEYFGNNGFGEESALRLEIARKIDEIAKGTPKGKTDKQEKLDVIEIRDDDTAQPELPITTIERKITVIKREQRFLDEKMKDAGRDSDDEEVRALRKRHFNVYKEDLADLLEKTEASARDMVLKKPRTT